MRIPIKIAQQISKDYNQTHVIIFTFDGEKQHIVTYGKNIEQCDQAASLGNKIKEFLGWEKFNDEPSRVTKLKKENKRLKEIIDRYKK